MQGEAEQDQLPMAQALGLAVLCWSPQARGALVRASPTEISPKLAGCLEAAAKDHGVTPGAIALAWLLTRNVFPVVGARDVGQLKPSLAAADLVMAASTMRKLNATTDPPQASDLAPLLAGLREGMGLDEAMLEQAARGPLTAA